jgi:hypothetical protein
VWGYALAWFLVNDRVKLLAYRIFGSSKADATARVKAIDARKAGAKPDVEAEPAALAAKAEASPEAKAVPAPDGKPRPKPDAKAELAPAATTEAKPDAKSDAKSEAKVEIKAELKPEAETKTSPDLTAKLVERVHALYEELGRQDVLAVQELEKAEQQSKQKESKEEASHR